MRKPSLLEQHLALKGNREARAANAAEAEHRPASEQAAMFWRTAAVQFAAAVEALEHGRRKAAADHMVGAKGWSRKAIDADQGLVVANQNRPFPV